jgi:putative FmdB family regulatory protein
MPIYEYNCDPCSHRFELIKPLSHHNKNEICPSCGGGASKLLSLFAYIGPNSGDNGFFSTDDNEFGGGCQAGQCACAVNSV